LAKAIEHSILGYPP